MADSNPRPDDPMDVDSEYGGSASNERIVHSNKRPRTSSTESTECPPKIAGIKDLSIELFIEVAKYLLPGDLLALARCCKPFRRCLMNKSSQFLWLEVMKNVKDLPPCPSGFTEPRYLTVLFSGFCTACASTKKSKLDTILLVKLCDRCQKQCLVKLIDPQVPTDIRPLIYKSNVFGKATRGRLPDACVLKSDLDSVVDALGEAERSGSDHVLMEFKKQMFEAVEERKSLSQKIIRAVELLENEISWEQKTIQTKRHLEIERRCIGELGWQREDLQFFRSSPSRKKYYQLLNRPGLLSDREWGEIRPQLSRPIRANRNARLAKEQEDREKGQSSYKGGPGCPQRPLILEIDPVMDGLSHIEQPGLLDEICG